MEEFVIADVLIHLYSWCKYMGYCWYSRQLNYCQHHWSTISVGNVIKA